MKIFLKEGCDKIWILVLKFTISNYHRVIIVLDLGVVQLSCDRIGNPVSFDASEPLQSGVGDMKSSSFNPPQQQQQQQQMMNNNNMMMSNNNMMQQQQQQQPMMNSYNQPQQQSSSLLTMTSDPSTPIFPISALNPYNNR